MPEETNTTIALASMPKTENLKEYSSWIPSTIEELATSLFMHPSSFLSLRRYTYQEGRVSWVSILRAAMLVLDVALKICRHLGED